MLQLEYINERRLWSSSLALTHVWVVMAWPSRSMQLLFWPSCSESILCTKERHHQSLNARHLTCEINVIKKAERKSGVFHVWNVIISCVENVENANCIKFTLRICNISIHMDVEFYDFQKCSGTCTVAQMSSNKLLPVFNCHA